MVDKKLVISSDSHIVEPPNLWTDRMDAKKWGDRIPHVVPGDLYDQWLADHQKVGVIGTFGATAGLRFERPQDIVREGRIADVRPGGYDPKARVKDIDMDGVYGEVIYPSIGLELFSMRDAAFARQVFHAYNDWVADFCRQLPHRLRGVAMLIIDDDIEAGITDLRQAAAQHFAGAMISVYPSPEHNYASPMYEPFWNAVEEVDLPLSLHVSTNRPDTQAPKRENLAAQSGGNRVNAEYWLRQSLCHLIYSGVFERHPGVKVVNVEHDLAWIPFFIQRMDVTYIERPTQTPYRFKSAALPSDFMRRNVFHSFQEDGLGVRDRGLIGPDNLLWGSDYPHAESTFPKSQQILESILEGVPEEDRLKIIGGNTKRLYKIT
ncbi:MAG: amidohydrolase [SAR202 cluster bacterium]|nr:amidohydrolase [SAR202 cluster bacterium]